MKTIPLTKGQHAIVDNEDYLKASKIKWHASANKNKFYAKNQSTDLHRFVFGKIPTGYILTFLNGNSLDCRKSNLKLVRKKGSKNNSGVTPKKVVKIHSGNPSHAIGADLSKFVGVVHDVRYAAKYVDANGREYNFGKYDTPEQAALEYNKGIRALQHSIVEKIKLNPDNLLPKNKI